MKESLLSILLVTFLCVVSSAQTSDVQIEGKEVFKNEDVVFHQIDEHTWVGSGHLVYNESLYLVEGENKAVLIDAGTRIKDLDKIVASITKKPIMLVATHVHGDHTGSAVNYFPELFINPGDQEAVPRVMPNYKGTVKYLKDGEIIDLGGRKLEVVFTPAHTPGSTTFIDKEAGYGFSGDSFGSGNLLLTMTFSTLIATCEKTSAQLSKYGVKYLYPGHYSGKNTETKKRVDDMITLSKDVLSGKVKGVNNPNGQMGLNLLVNDYGVKINYTEKAVK
jgi:hydroxyacylglutathione hydrolase